MTLASRPFPFALRLPVVAAPMFLIRIRVINDGVNAAAPVWVLATKMPWPFKLLPSMVRSEIDAASVEVLDSRMMFDPPLNFLMIEAFLLAPNAY